MLPLVLTLSLSGPADAPAFTASGTGDESPTGRLTALSLLLGARVETADGPKTVRGLVALRRPDLTPPALPTGPQLITAGGDRLPGVVRGGDSKLIQFRPAINDDDWPIPLDTIAAVWLVAPPADTPTDPARYAWLAGSPPRDVLLYRNGDTVRGALSGFTDTGVNFKPDGGEAREVSRKDLAAIGFNPRFARPRRVKGAFAHLVLDDGTRFDVADPNVKGDGLVARVACGPAGKPLAVEVPLARLVSVEVFHGSATYLSDVKPKKAETTGFLGEGWTWTADRTVRGQPLRLLLKEGEGTFDKGLGTHPKTVLTYELGGKYVRFEALVGLDAATGKRGRADVRIRVDGKELDLPALKSLATGPVVPLRVDVRGAKELVLVVDFGPTGDVQADVNWGNARLVSE